MKTITPVSSPTMHSAIRKPRIAEPSCLARFSTILLLTTFTVIVWPDVAGRNWLIFTKVGFASIDALAAAESSAIGRYNRNNCLKPLLLFLKFPEQRDAQHSVGKYEADPSSSVPESRVRNRVVKGSSQSRPLWKA